MNSSCALIGGMSVSFVTAFLSAWWIYRPVLRIAMEKNIVDNPCVRKLQKEPVPVLGGVAVAFGVIAATFFGGIFFDVRPLYPLICILMAMLCMGVMDDMRGLSPYLRFAVEILVVLSLVYTTGFGMDDFHGLWGIGRLPAWIALPLTVFSGVGIINSINLIDGVNGLCSGFCIFACIAFGVFFSVVGEMCGACLAAACAGALIPFLLHNVFGLTSKMFIGDGGTMFMGTVMTCFVIGTLGGNTTFQRTVPEDLGLVPFSLSVLALPVFDTVRVMTVRILHHKSPFKADKTHLHHLLFGLHFSHIGTTCTEILLNALVVGAWWLSYALGASVDVQLCVVAMTGLCFTFGLSGGIIRVRCRHPKLYKALLRFGDWTHVGHSKWFAKVRKMMDR